MKLRDLVAGVCEDLAARAREKALAMDNAVEEDLVAPVDAERMQQVLFNLIDNAINHSEEGKSVTIKAQEKAQELLIQVQDQGSGIERKHLERIFERFYRVDKSRSRKLGGTGLGLAIVKHIAQAHGGRVSVESQISVGSTFTLHLRQSK